jgi:hypothetical protein
MSTRCVLKNYEIVGKSNFECEPQSGDQIDYSFNTTAGTANLESIKILLNAMISDDIQLTTVDLEDFYLGNPLPHPEYIRIPTRFIPPKVVTYYKLVPYLNKDALYCAVLKTPLWSTTSWRPFPRAPVRALVEAWIHPVAPLTIVIPQSGWKH